MFKRMLKRKGKLRNVLALGLALSVAVGSSAFALNYDSSGYGGNKPISFAGYAYQDTTHIIVYLDKETASPGEVDASMFTVKQHGGSAVTVSSISKYSGGTSGEYSDTSDTGITKGTKVVLNLGSSLSYNTLYDVTISNTLMDKGGITLGNYSNKKDLTFTLKTPNSSGNYEGATPYVTFVVGDPDSTTNVSYESNAILIFDRPIDTSALSTFKTDLNSSTAFRNTTDSTTVPGNEAGNVVSNDKNSLSNTFYFPETYQTSGGALYNRQTGTHSYTLTLPSASDFTDVSGNTASAFKDAKTGNTVTSYSFSTAAADYPGWERNAYNPNTNITVTAGTGSLSVSWTDTNVTPNPAGYKLYITSAASNPNRWTGTYTYSGVYTTGDTTSTSITGLDNTKYYWVRVVPYDSAGKEVGYSISSASAVKPN